MKDTTKRIWLRIAIFLGITLAVGLIFTIANTDLWAAIQKLPFDWLISFLAGGALMLVICTKTSKKKLKSESSSQNKTNPRIS